MVSGPAGSSIDPETGHLTWTPSEIDGPGTHEFDVTLTDDGNPPLSAARRYSVFVAEMNTAPSLASVSSQVVDELTPFELALSATDGDLPANGLVFELASGPGGLTVSAAGEVTWTPEEAQGPGNHTITVRVTDDGAPSLSDETTFTITVDEVNSTPELSGPGDQSIEEAEAFELQLTASDVDEPANSLRFELFSGPEGLVVSESGMLTWTPTEAQGPEAHEVSVRVTDSGEPPMSAATTFNIAVSEVNTGPALALPSQQTIAEQQMFTVMLTATDADEPANGLAFELVSGPEGLVVNEEGELAWTPSEEQGPGDYEVTFTAADDGTPPESTTEIVTITVVEVNLAPELEVVEDRTVNPGETVELALQASDADMPANLLSFLLVAGPPEAELDQGTGEFFWEVPLAESGRTLTITVSVQDDAAVPLASNRSFVVRVRNVRPSLSSQGAALTGEGFVLQFTGEPGMRFMLEGSADLRE